MPKKGSKRAGRVEFYRDDAGEHRWRVKSPNGKILADSGEGYKREGDALAAFATVVGEVRTWPRFSLYP